MSLCEYLTTNLNDDGLKYKDHTHNNDKILVLFNVFKYIKSLRSGI